MRCRLAFCLQCVMLMLALGLPAPPVLAQVQVDAQASGLRHTLTDLAPGDAVAPELRLSTVFAPEVRGGLRVFLWDFPHLHDDYQVMQGPGKVVLEQEWGTAIRSRASFEAGGSPVMAMSIGVQPHDQNIALMDVTVDGGWYGFSLSPHTSVSFAFDASLRLSMAPELPDSHWRGEAAAYLTLLADDPDTGYFSDGDQLVAWVGQSDHGPSRLQDGKDGLLTVTYTNSSDAWVSGDLFHRLAASALVYNDIAPPVPEPSTWAMLVAGAALLGVLRRQGRRRP